MGGGIKIIKELMKPYASRRRPGLQTPNPFDSELVDLVNVKKIDHETRQL